MSDLTVTNHDGTSHEYLIAVGEANPVVHQKSAPNVPLQTGGTSSPTQAGGQYDVRDSEGGKAIAHLDWSLGAGQKTLDTQESNSSKFLASASIDVSRPGEMRLLRTVTDTHVENTAGPAFSACGYLWLGGAKGTLKYSSDNGANWTSATIGGTAITAAISSFCTDGVKVYFCVPSGASKGIWANTAATPGTFAKFGSTGTTEEIRHLAYSGGYLYAATAAGAGWVDATTGVYTKKTSLFLNTTNTSVALAAAGNSVFWVVAQGNRSYVYMLYTDALNTTVYTEQYAEFPSGFKATCALGYLSTVYIGGYFESAYSGVGKGAVYVCAEGYAAPLFEIGEQPETTDVPASTDNDNRIYALCEAGKDLYVLTNNACYRWDIDGGGYSHAFPFTGAGASELVTTWSAGSAISWDGTDPGGGMHLPSGYVTTESGTGTPSFSYTGGVFAYNCSDWSPVGKWSRMDAVCTPTGGEVFNNATGTTVEFSITQCQGSSLGISLRDGSYETRVIYHKTWINTLTDVHHYVYLLEYDGATGLWYRDAYPKFFELPQTGQMYTGAHTLKITLQGTLATLYIDGVAVTSTYYVKPNAAANALTLQLIAGTLTAFGGHPWDYTEFLAQPGLLYADWYSGINIKSLNPPGSFLPYGSYANYIYIDSIKVNNAGWQPAASTSDTVFRPSIAHHKGALLAPYAVGTDAKSLTITAATVANPTIITTSAAHGIAGTTQVINISGSNSTPTIDGNHTATYIDATRFSIPVNVTIAATTGSVKYNHNTGYSLSASTYATSGWLTQSPTNFHAGSILKDFRYVSVAHDPLPVGTSLTMQWWIDGSSGNVSGVTSGQETRFTINARGYSIKTKIGLLGDGSATPVVKSVNVVWDFVKSVKHQYLLDCRNGLRGWSDDPETAIAFLFATADEEATFTDRFEGEYEGTIEQVEFVQANRSLRVGYEGLLRVTVREAM